MDYADFINNLPELNPIVNAFSVDLILDLGGTQYLLGGGDQEETLEALWAKSELLKQMKIADENQFVQILQNVEFNPDTEEPLFLIGDEISEVPEFPFKQFSLLRSNLHFLLSI